VKSPEPRQPSFNAAEIADRTRRAAQRERLHRIRVTIEALIVQFPECFKPPGQPPRPLKIGIHLDVAAALPDIT
jgi:sRNA-binding protein